MVAMPTEGLLLDSYADVGEALNDSDLSRSLDRDRYEDENILEGVLMMLDSTEHRDRRRVENAQFRRDRIERYDQHEFPAIIDRTLDSLLTASAADLLTIGALLSVELSARTAGVDFDPTSAGDRQELVDLLQVFADGISIDAGTGDVEATKAAVRAALEAFRGRFFAPSLAARESAVAAFRRGERTEDDLPSDILTTLLMGSEALGLREDQLLRETAFFLEAGAHTSSQSLASTMDFIFHWAGTSDERWQRLGSDRSFIQRCVHEALRLRPTNPMIRRRAIRDTRIGSRAVSSDTLIYLNTFQANRDQAVFGQTAAEFDPEREVPMTAARYGHSFGGGIHACIGRNLAIGYPIRSDGPPPADHAFGLVTLMAQALIERGVRPDPVNPPTLDTTTSRWTRWASYPIRVPSA